MKKFFLSLNILLGVMLEIAPSAPARLVNHPMIEPSKGEPVTVKYVRLNRLKQNGFLLNRTKFNFSPTLLAQIPEDTGSYSPKVIQRDYEVDSPLPITGQTTILNFINNLNACQMFQACPENSQLIEFAESENFLVQICLKDTNNDSTVFWMGYAKDGRGSITVRIDRNFEFWNVDTYYAIEQRYQGENSYLLIGWPNGNLQAEALLYYYYPCFGADC